MITLHHVVLFIFSVATWHEFEKAAKEKNWIRFFVAVIMMFLLLIFSNNK